MKTFNWETGISLEDARERLKKNSDKRFSNKKEVYAWSSAGEATETNNDPVMVAGTSATFSKTQVTQDGASFTLLTLTNTRTDSAVQVSYIIDGQLRKQTFTIEPGKEIQIKLSKFINLELLVKPIQKGLQEEPELIDNIKGYIRQWFIQEQGGVKLKKVGSIGPRG